MIKFKASLWALAVAAPLASLSLPSMAGVDLIVKIAPPAPRVEVVPPPRVGFVWAPGYWNWNGRSHVWVAGTWVPERRGYVYVRPTWVQHNGEWHLTRGNWARGDADHDGIQNRFDHDKDNDGRGDRRDPKPNVPN